MTLGKWLIYTVMLALSPVLCRLLIAGLIPGIRWVSESDVMSFGLILVVTNISGLESSTAVDPHWKTINIGISLLLVVLFAVLFAVSCFHELPANPVSETHVLYGGLIVSVASIVLSYSIWNRLGAQKEP